MPFDRNDAPVPSMAVKKVQWFLENLNLQISERQLRNDGRSTLIFFDTAGVRVALLGIDNFLTEARTFNVKFFKKKPTLVYALASAGWLGPLNMLLPHQDEFRAQASLDFGTESHGSDFRLLVHRFLDALRINKEVLDSKKFRYLDHEAAIKFVRANAESAEKLFKVIQFIGGTWRTKLVDWLDSGQLLLSEESLDFTEVMGGMTFQRLRQAFGFYRKNKDVNNSVDALALAEFSRKLRRANAERQPLPIIFSPEGFFEKVLRKAGLESRFCYTGEDGSLLSAVRGPDYFIFKAIFNPPSLLSGGEGLASRASMEELYELRDRVSLILKARSDLEEALESVTGLGGKPLGKLIDEIKTLSFFENVWLPLSPDSIQRVEQEIQEVAENLRTPAYQKAVDEALTRAKQEIENKTKTYEELTALWERLGSATREIKRRDKNARGVIPKGRSRGEKERDSPLQELDPFLHFGLLRFSLVRSSHVFIRNTIAALVSGSSLVERDAQRKLLSKYRRARIEAPCSEELLAEIAGVFWCLQLDREIVTLLEACRPLSSFSLDILLAAAYFRLNEKVGQGNLLLQELGDRYKDLPPNKAGQLKLGLGYLSFHLILCLDLAPGEARKDVVRELYENAIACADTARGLLHDQSVQVYALNNYLYYMVQYESEQYLEQMRVAAEELKKWIDRPGIWQYRFDDTLSRYYHFLSNRRTDEKSRELAREQALEFNDRAWRASLGDSEVLRFRSNLVNIA